jgi:hypothetical protein
MAASVPGFVKPVAEGYKKSILCDTVLASPGEYSDELMTSRLSQVVMIAKRNALLTRFQALR